MTLQEIKDQYAKEQGYPSYDEMENHYIDHNLNVNVAILIRAAWEDIAHRYATACCKATLKKQKDLWEQTGFGAAKDEILDPSNIVIL